VKQFIHLVAAIFVGPPIDGNALVG